MDEYAILALAPYRLKMDESVSPVLHPFSKSRFAIGTVCVVHGKTYMPT